MERELNKNCSQSEQNGLNSGECSNKVFKLFGVTIFSQVDEEMMRKSASMGNLASRNGSEQSPSEDLGYLSEDLQSSGKEKNQRKKGVPWTEEEHGAFLAGLERLGKGDWKGISRNFVKTKNPTQVASHAQKHFLRKTAPKHKKRKPSVFDMEINNNASTSEAAPASSLMGANNIPENIILHNHDNYLSGNVAKNQEAIETSPILSTLSFVPASIFANPSNAMPLSFPDGSAFTPSFLQISMNSSPQPTPYRPPQVTPVPPLMENCNLELTIAPSWAS